MIIDSNLVFTDGPLTSSGVSDPVALTSLFKPGKAEALPIVLRVTEDFVGPSSLVVKLTQCPTESGSYTDVPGATLTIPLADLKTGKQFAWHFLPATTEKPWLKLAYTLSGTASAGQLFAAVMRENEALYEADMMIKG